MTTKRRIGVLGTGRQALEHRLPALLHRPIAGRAEVVAVADVATEAAHRALRQLQSRSHQGRLRAAGYDITHPSDVRVYSSLVEMIAHHELDGVVITTPHAYHAAATITALEAGLDVMVEKPMATTPADARRMVAAARANGRLLAVGYQNAFALDGISELVNRNGRPLGARGLWRRQNGIPGDAHFWADEVTGGVTLDLGGHLLAPLVVLLGERIASVRAWSRNEEGRAAVGDEFRAEDTVEAVIEWEDGSVAKIEASWSDRVPWDEQAGLEVYWDRARADVPFVPQKYEGYVPDLGSFLPVVRAEGADEPAVLGAAPLGYVQLILAQTSNWIGAMHGTEVLRFSGEDALAVELALAAMRESFTTGRTVEIGRD